jgi:hypothetical protein
LRLAERSLVGVASVVCGVAAVANPIAFWAIGALATMQGRSLGDAWILLLLPLSSPPLAVLGAGLGVYAYLRGDRKWGGAGAGICLVLLVAAVLILCRNRAEARRATLYVGSAEEIQRELQRGADPNMHGWRYADDDGDTPLHHQSAGNDLAAMGALIDGGADPNQPNGSGFTPLHEAARHGRPLAAWVLLDNGAEVDARTSGGDTPLLWAIRAGLGAPPKMGSQASLTDDDSRSGVRVPQVLLEYGADPNVENDHGETALHCAADAMKDRSDAVALLLEHGASINAQDCYGSTALHRAAANGHRRVVEVLLEHGADLEVLDGQGYTPLGWAAARGHLRVARVLLEAGADPNAERVAPTHRPSDEMAALLREYRADE